MAGLSGVVVCEYESQFNPRAFRVERNDHTSYGLWQLCSEYHPQYRDDLLLHLAYGAEFWKACLEKANGGLGAGVENSNVTPRSPESPSIARAYSIYNSGSPTRSIEKGRAVQRRYESLAMYLWRRLR
jgi:hypothetical protein